MVINPTVIPEKLLARFTSQRVNRSFLGHSPDQAVGPQEPVETCGSHEWWFLKSGGTPKAMVGL